ncbi:MAG: LamG domain-containing protein [Endomicrobiia bacterium]|nr:LamG domain-containing protein [Endomicrobiia bacterium]
MANITDNLIARYPLESPYDSSGNARTLTVTGATVDTTTFKLGGAGYNFDGVDDEMSSTATGLDGLTAFSASLWVYLDTKGNGERFINKGEGNAAVANANAFSIGLDGSVDQKGRFRLYVGDGTTEATIVSDSAFSTGVWVHMVCVWDGTTIKMYLNNAQQTQTASISGTMPNINDTTYPFSLGMRIYNTTTKDLYMDGRLDEIVIWSRALTTTEISQLYNGGTGREVSAWPGTGGRLVNGGLVG